MDLFQANNKKRVLYFVTDIASTHVNMHMGHDQMMPHDTHVVPTLSS